MSEEISQAIPTAPAKLKRGGKKRNQETGIDGIRKRAAGDLAKVLKLRFVDHLSYVDIANLMGMDDGNVCKMCAPFKVIMENPDEIRQYKLLEPNILDGIRMLMTQGMVDQLTDPVRRKKMDLSRLTYGYGILYDKARLERGEATEINLSLSDLVKAAHAKEVPAEAEVVEEALAETEVTK